MTNHPQQEASYPIDTENIAEMARLTRQAHEATRYLGLFPQGLDLTQRTNMLDIACGPGEWAITVAQQFPESQVTGLDISQTMIAYARFLAQEQKLQNVCFEIMDARQPLDFPDASFDVAHARAITGFMSPAIWPQLVGECFRLLQPGGVFFNTEFENMGITTSQSFTRYNALMIQALRRSGHCFTASGDAIGITAMQARLLLDAGFQDIRQQAHVANFSAGMPEHDAMYDDWKALMKLIQPFLLHLKLISPEELNVLYERTLEEMQADTFCAVAYFQSVWGRKPA